MENIKQNAHKLLKFGKKKADYIVVNVNKTVSEGVGIKNNNLDTLDYSNSCMYVINLWKNGQKGVSYGSKFSLDLVNKALKIAKASKKLEYFYGLPGRSKVIYPKNFDKKILEIDEEKLISMAKQMIKSVKAPKITFSKGGLEKHHSFGITLNSQGVNISEESTSFSAFVGATGRTNGKVTSSWQWDGENFLFKYDYLIKRAKKECLDFLKAKKLTTKVTNVILKPESLSELLMYAFLTNFNGKSVEKKQSCFVDKLDEKIFDPNFSINDNGILNKGVNSSAVDFEGSPNRDTKLIDKGVLKSFVYDHNTAKHFGKESTGNASSQGIGFTNIVLNGKYHKINKGLIVGSIIGAHTSNALATDFSVRADNCYYYKNGEKIPVKGVMLSGKMLNVLANIVSIDKKKVQRGGVYTGSLVSDKINVIIH